MEDFRISPFYKGPRSIVVPVKMYSRNSFLNAFGVQSRRWLGINLDRFTLSFHRSRSTLDPRNELFFWQIKAVDADMSRSYEDKYFLNIQTIDKVYNFKFRNVYDFFIVVEALRHTLRNNQPFYVSREDYAKLALLQKRSDFNSNGQINSGMDNQDQISSDEDFESSKLSQKVIGSPNIYTKSEKKTEVRTTVTPNVLSVAMPMQAPPPVIPTIAASHLNHRPSSYLTQEEYQYQKWRNMDKYGTSGSQDARQSFERAFEVPMMQSPIQNRTAIPQSPPSPPIVVQTKASRVEERVTTPPSPLITPTAQRLPTQTQIFSPGSSPILPQTMTSPVLNRVNLLEGKGLEKTSKVVNTTVSTVVPPPPAISPTQNLSTTDFQNLEIRLAEEEKELAIKQEELRQREAILRLQKLNIKRTELETRKEALLEKESELKNVEQDIKVIQTDIAQIKNKIALDKMNSRDHREIIEKSRLLHAIPLVTQVPGEIVQVDLKETKTVMESVLSPRRVDVFPQLQRSSNQGYDSYYSRY